MVFQINHVFAQTLAKVRGAERQGLTMLTENVHLVGKSSEQTNTLRQNVALEAVQTTGVSFAKIKKIRRLPAEPVYNMEVEQHHNFAVNGGLIVHNCIDSLRYAAEPLIGMRRLQTMSKSSLGL